MPGIEANRGLLPEQLGDYRIIREIGHGGMGVVYEAEQVSLGATWRSRCCRRRWFVTASSQQRFEREARAAAKLHHTNIVRSSAWVNTGKRLLRDAVHPGPEPRCGYRGARADAVR